MSLVSFRGKDTPRAAILLYCYVDSIILCLQSPSPSWITLLFRSPCTSTSLIPRAAIEFTCGEKTGRSLGKSLACPSPWYPVSRDPWCYSMAPNWPSSWQYFFSLRMNMSVGKISFLKPCRRGKGPNRKCFPMHPMVFNCLPSLSCFSPIQWNSKTYWFLYFPMLGEPSTSFLRMWCIQGLIQENQVAQSMFSLHLVRYSVFYAHT